jgi:hypothetical protein
MAVSDCRFHKGDGPLTDRSLLEGNMKTLPIAWQRLVSNDGRTCLRCDARHQHLGSAVAKLKVVLKLEVPLLLDVPGQSWGEVNPGAPPAALGLIPTLLRIAPNQSARNALTLSPARERRCRSTGGIIVSRSAGRCCRSHQDRRRRDLAAARRSMPKART